MVLHVPDSAGALRHLCGRCLVGRPKLPVEEPLGGSAHTGSSMRPKSSSAMLQYDEHKFMNLMKPILDEHVCIFQGDSADAGNHFSNLYALLHELCGAVGDLARIGAGKWLMSSPRA